MNVEELKKKTILVQYIVPDIAPSIGLKRMQYYASFTDDVESFHFGLSIRKKYSREKLEKMVEEKKLIKIPEAIVLPHDEDIFLDQARNLLTALAWNPSVNQNQITNINNL